eukprot:15464049-Alexandrium_andersonii.AAC.1
MPRASRSRRNSWISHFRWSLTMTTMATGGLLAWWQRMRAAWLLVRPLVLRRRVPVPERASSFPRPG